MLTFEKKSRGDNTQKTSRRTKLILRFITLFHHRSVMLKPYVIQSFKMRTMRTITFVSFYHEVLEYEEVYNCVNEK